MRFSIFLLLLFIPLIPALQITEIELNPSGTDGGHEWVELYSSEEIYLGDYIFINNDGKELIINKPMEGYYFYIFKSQWLDNTEEKISIYKGGNLIDETPIFEDIFNDERTFSLCETWIFQKGTKGKENCEETAITEIEEEIPDKEPIKRIDKNLSFTKGTKEIIQPEIINLNPKTIKTQDSTSKIGDSKILKYSFGIFCVLLLFLYLIKPRKRKNEWRNKSYSDDGY